MPSRNIIRLDSDHSYYHVYARGASKQVIFPQPADYAYFVGLFARYLSKEQAASKLTVYPHYRNQVELLAYCLMPNHFHLLLYQVQAGALAAFMRSLQTSYSMYFNRKYGRSGSPFESRYKASRIDADNYLEHISRYIHLNPRYYKSYAYSSYQAYVSGTTAEWLQPDRILNLFASPAEYRTFVSDYEEHKQMLDAIKHQLASH